MGAVDYRKHWNEAYPWADYLGTEVQEHRKLWEAVWQRATVPEWARAQAARLGGEWRLLVISEDWCGDASNTVPVLAKLAEEVPGMEMRVVKRDQNLALMDAHLTGGSRSIPLAVLLRPDFTVAGQWGAAPGRAAALRARGEARGGTPGGRHLPRRAHLVRPRPRREHHPRAPGTGQGVVAQGRGLRGTPAAIVPDPG
jgi:hypothetical protein